MIPVYICSNGARAGKTALALALAQRWTREGLAVGYWKLLGAASSGEDDAAFAKDALQLQEDVASLAPLLPNDRDGLSRQVRASLKAAEKKDVLLIEEDSALDVDQEDVLFGALLGAAPGLRALYLARYRGGDLAERVASAQRTLGMALAGTIINAVPPPHEWFVVERVLPDLTARGIPVFGTLPQDRAIATFTIRELCSLLSARILVNEAEAGMDEPFDSVMFGSMSAEDGLSYFSQKANKLVVSRGDRPDVHMAALGTSTRCLLLTGGYPSYPFVLDRAEELGVPVLSVSDDMPATIERLDSFLELARARDVGKIRRFGGLLHRYVDWSALQGALGLEN